MTSTPSVVSLVSLVSLSQLAVRGLLAGAAVALVVLTSVVSPAPIVALGVLLVALTVLAAVRPQSRVVTVLLVGLVLNWLASVPVPDALGSWLTLGLAGWLGLVVHLSASLAASLPGPTPIPRATLRTWSWRTAAVTGLMVPVWAIAAVSGLRAVPGDLGLTYAALAALALLGLGAWLVLRRSG